MSLQYLSLLLPGCTDSNFQDLQKSACGGNPKAEEASRGAKELSTDISALCLLQILKKLIYARVKPTFDSSLPRQQAEFRHEKSTVD